MLHESRQWAVKESSGDLLHIWRESSTGKSASISWTLSPGSGGTDKRAEATLKASKGTCPGRNWNITSHGQSKRYPAALEL